MLHAAVPAEIRALPKLAKARVKEAIDGLAAEPIPIGASRLKGRQNAYRLRVADYRILYEIHATEVVVYIVGVAHRKDVYRHILRRR